MDCSGYESFSQFSSGHGLTETLGCFFQHAPVSAGSAGASLWMIIALPLLGAFVAGVFGRALGRANTHLVTCGAVFGSFLLSILVFWTTADMGSIVPNIHGGSPWTYAVGADFGTWFQAGEFQARLGLYADHLSGTMLLVITGVGFLIHLYATEYMSHDAGYWRFFAYLNLFVAMMLTLVLADSLVLLFVGWEGVGMCSYLLIGFWYDDDQKAFAGRKAFITNRIGDFGFLVASFLLVLTIGAYTQQSKAADFGASAQPNRASAFAAGVAAKGPLAFQTVEEFSRAMPQQLDTEIEHGPLKGHTFGGVLTLILLCFLLGAAGKSAQLPLYVWLPDAMAGPTPVSALIHAATMVTAGVYLFCRLGHLLVLSPVAMATVSVVGALTAVLAAAIAFAQDDLKKVLAYSTVSQLGMMFMAVGAGVYWAAFLHVVTHAFFKACLFLGAGSVMHGNADEGNFKKLGGLRTEMKVTWATFLVATLAITGIVPLSGFFSKDAILDGVHNTTLEHFPNVMKVVWVLGLVTAAFTAFYMTRLYTLTFEGERAKDARVPHAHESAPAMTGVLVVLAVLSVAALAHGIPFMENARGPSEPKQTLMENFLSPVFNTAHQVAERVKTAEVEHEEGLPWGGWIRAWVIAVVSGGLSFFLYTRVLVKGAAFPAALQPLRTAAQAKFYVDELYEVLFIRPVKLIAFLFWKVVDAVLIDTVGVRGTAWVTARSGSMLRYFQTGDAQGYAAVMALALAGGLAWALFKVIS